MHRSPDGKFAEQKVIVGTHTSDSEQNSLMIAKVKLSVEGDADGGKDGDGDVAVGPKADYDSSAGKIEIIAAVNHEGEVNR